eukprot:COSAG02_NODE_1452_length_12551_cov_15.613877_3_plen_69_part_00
MLMPKIDTGLMPDVNLRYGPASISAKQDGSVPFVAKCSFITTEFYARTLAARLGANTELIVVFQVSAL